VSTPDRVAVVTGGGRGMGRAIVHALSREGLTVVAVARSRYDLDATVRTAPGPGAVEGRTCDVGTPAEVDALFDALRADHGRVDVLVCSHGTYQGGHGALDLPLEQYDRTMAVNLRGTFHCAQHAGRLMRDGGRGGRIVLISSMNGEAAQTGAADYDTSKAAVNGLVRALAVDVAPLGITVNGVAPGWVRTPMSEDELEHLEGAGLVMNPLGTVGTPEDVALAVLWLTDPANGYVTGSVVRVDGGQLAMLPRPWRAGEPSIV
jgi:NAD(P)-dependent dehydrogenase (short-subunit alcohol dehydrogenase family)